MHQEAVDLTREFAAMAPPSPLGVDFHAYFAGTGERAEHLLIGVVIHGNEYGTLPAAVRLLRELQEGSLVPAGPTSLLLGNVAAVEQDARFVEEDFNRVFTFDRAAESLERKRAEQVRRLLDRVDFFLDLHQTQTPTESAFWTFPFEPEFAHWARAIGAAPLALTRAPSAAFAPGRRCLDEYVRDRGRPAITVELGEKGLDPQQAEVAHRACRRLVECYDRVCTGTPIEEIASQAPALSWYQTKDVFRPDSPEYRLRDGLGNWTEVAEGQLLSASGSPEIRAAESGRILFPKYPPLGEMAPELFRLATEIADPFRHFSTG